MDNMMVVIKLKTNITIIGSVATNDKQTHPPPPDDAEHAEYNEKIIRFLFYRVIVKNTSKIADFQNNKVREPRIRSAHIPADLYFWGQPWRYG